MNVPPPSSSTTRRSSSLFLARSSPWPDIILASPLCVLLLTLFKCGEIFAGHSFGLQQRCFSFIDELENGESFLQHSVAMCHESFGLVGNLRRHRAYSPRCFHLQEINIK